MDELVLGMPHRQDRTRRLAYHLLRHATKQDMDQSRVAMRAHHDDVDVLFLGELDDLVKGGPFAHLLVDRELLEMVFARRALQSVLDGGGHLRDRWADRR